MRRSINDIILHLLFTTTSGTGKKKVKGKLNKAFPALFLSLLFCCVLCLRGNANAQSSIDSLQQLLKTAKEDKEKVNILNTLFSKTRFQSVENAFPFAEQALKLARKISDKPGQAKALENISLFYRINNNIEKAIEYNVEALMIRNNIGEQPEIVNTLMAAAELYKLQLNYDKAMAHYLKALKIAEDYISENSSSDKISVVKAQQARLLYLIGRIYQEQHNYSLAKNYYSKALEIYTATNDEKGLADVSLSLAIVLYDSSNNDKSQTFVFKGTHKEAMENALKAKKIFEKINDANGMVRANNHLAYISAGRGDFAQGVKYAQEGLDVASQVGNKEMVASLNGTIGDIYYAQGDYKKALEYINKCYEGAKAINNNHFIRDIYLSYASIYAKLNDFKKAYQYHILYNELKDSLLNEQSNKQIAEINAKYDSEKKNKELIKKDAELAQQQAETRQQHTQRNALIVSFVLLIFIAFFIYRGYRNNKRANANIIRQKDEIEKSYKNISILSEIEQEITSSHTIERIIEKVYENVNKLMDADVFCIGVHNEKNNSIDFPGFIENGKKYNSAYKLTDHIRLPVLCFNNNREIFINDMEKEYSHYVPSIKDIPEPVAGERPESLIFLPLIYKEKTIGVINVESFSKNAYNKYHLEILKNLAVYVAIALENAQLYKNLEEKIQERTTEVLKQKEEVEKSYENTKLLSTLGREITVLLNVDEIIQKVYENVNRLMDASAFGIGIYRPEKKGLEFTFIEKGVKLPNNIAFLDDETRPAVWCFKTQQEMIINDFEREYSSYMPTSAAPQPLQGDNTESVIYMPLSISDKHIGAITVQSFKKNAYSPYQVDILRNLAVYVVSALDNARLYESMEEQVKQRTEQVTIQKEELEISYNNIHVLSEIGQQITSTIDFEGIFQKLHENISRLMDAECFGVRIYHPETETVEVKYEYDKGRRINPFSFSMENESNFSVWCIKNKKEIFINDNAKEYTNYVKDIVVISGDMTHSLMFCPMILKDEVVGVITVQSYQKNQYTKHHLDILRSLANYAAIALENAELYEGLEEKVKERTAEVLMQKEEVEKSYENTKLLSEIGREITSVLTVEEIIKKAYENVNRLMDASAFGIGIYNSDKNQIEFSGFIEKGERLPFYFVSISEVTRPAIWCFREQRELIINDFQKEFNQYFPDQEIPAPKEGEQPDSIIYLPLSTPNKRVGVITVQSFKKNAYSAYQLNILRNLALYVVNGLENARLYENMEDEVKARTLEIEKQKNELARLSLVASETDNGVLIFNDKGEIEWVNDGFTRLQGYTLEELKKKHNTIEKISNNPEIAALVEDSIKNKKSSVYQSLNITKAGKELWVQSSLTPIMNEHGKITNWVVIDVDITNLKKAEDSIRQQNEKITDSINYAQKIQETLLPPLDEIKRLLPQSFILYRPKDIVSGDFYWLYRHQQQIFIAVADCTGHGVPGAFMSLMGNNLLNDIVKVKGKHVPSEILEELNVQILTTLNQNSKTTSVKYGMDIALVCMEQSVDGSCKLQYSGAHSPLLVFRNNECIQIKGDKRSIGSYIKEEDSGFTNHEMTLLKEDMIYMFSDGYADQIGGPESKKMFAQPFRDLLQLVAQMDVNRQKEKLENNLAGWQGQQSQTDDILVLGIRI